MPIKDMVISRDKLKIEWGRDMPHTSYVTNTTTSLYVDLKHLKATRYVITNITALITREVPVTTLIKRLSIYITNLATNVYVDGKLYTTLRQPTRYLSTVIVETIVQSNTSMTGGKISRRKAGGRRIKTVKVR